MDSFLGGTARSIRTRAANSISPRTGRRRFGASLLAAILLAGTMATWAGSTGVATAQAAVSPTMQSEIGALAAREKSQHCSAFRTGCKSSTQWCATFALWVWQHADAAIEYQPITTDPGSLYTYGTTYGTTSSTPHVGDAAVFSSSSGGGDIVHVRIVASTANGTVTAYGGNENGTNNDGLTSYVGKSTWPVSTAIGKPIAGQYLYKYISPVVRVTASITPSSQSVGGGSAAKWTVNMYGGSGHYTVTFNSGDSNSTSWSTTANSTAYSKVLGAYPCPGEAAMTLTQTVTVSDSKYTPNKAVVTATTKVNPGKLC